MNTIPTKVGIRLKKDTVPNFVQLQKNRAVFMIQGHVIHNFDLCAASTRTCTLCTVRRAWPAHSRAVPNVSRRRPAGGTMSCAGTPTSGPSPALSAGKVRETVCSGKPGLRSQIRSDLEFPSTSGMWKLFILDP